MMSELILYYKPACGYCQKVLRFMEKNTMAFPMKNTGESVGAREELLKVGGKSQVPCLFIDGRPLYESDDIIRWLGANWGKS
jgi:glutaredoxin